MLTGYGCALERALNFRASGSLLCIFLSENDLGAFLTGEEAQSRLVALQLNRQVSFPAKLPVCNARRSYAKDRNSKVMTASELKVKSSKRVEWRTMYVGGSGLVGDSRGSQMVRTNS
eukprot:1973482-Rhodomonas_salina.2